MDSTVMLWSDQARSITDESGGVSADVDGDYLGVAAVFAKQFDLASWQNVEICLKNEAFARRTQKVVDLRPIAFIGTSEMLCLMFL